MPYIVEDVDKHKKGLSDKGKEQWVTVANSVLAKCVEGGGEEAECAAKAVQQASGVLKKRQEEAKSMPDENELNEAVVNDLPDSSFALILPGGEKDDEGIAPDCGAYERE